MTQVVPFRTVPEVAPVPVPTLVPGVLARRWDRDLSRQLVALDLLLASVSALAALRWRFGDHGGLVYALLTAAFPLVFVGLIALCRGYESRFLGGGSEEYRRVSDAGVRCLAAIAVATYAAGYDLARGYVVVAVPLATGSVLAGRYAARSALHRARRAGRYQHRVLVVGRERSASELIRQLRRESHTGFEVVGAWLAGSAAPTVEGVPVSGRRGESVAEAVRATGADTVAVGAWSPLSQDDLRRLCWELEGTGVSVVVAPSLTDVAGPRIHIRPVAGLPLLHVEQPEFTGARRIAKGLFDRGAALAALVLLTPVLLVVAVLVRLDSSGPALFHQERVGKGGTNFLMTKFRSMHVDAEQRRAALVVADEAADGLLFKIRKDPRVTSTGAWLRKYSLDELPQLLNVLRGQMSLVGPRPPLPSEVERYGDDVRRRLLVKPGLTGLWQVSGRSDLSWEESVRLDLHYVENWSLALDVSIILRTVKAVLQGSGAY